jgi:Major Facilitator Superfamily
MVHPVIHSLRKRARGPEALLILMAFSAALAFSTWDVLLNNFVIEKAAFTGRELGLLQSLREVPGFLAFTAVLVLLVVREQTFALLSLLLLGAGVALTGFLPTEYGLYFTTLLMSTGFHYFYTLQQSLTLQWVEVERAPVVLGRLASFASIAALISYSAVWLGMQYLDISYESLYLGAGGLAILITLLAWWWFPLLPHKVPQRKHLLMRRRYWLFYGLTFLSGARRQIFMVFASFLMVEKFGYSAANMALLFLANHAVNSVVAPRVGHFIARFGERRALTLEYSGLIVIFTAYAFVSVAWVAAVLFVLDHILYSMAIAIKSYFQKIADPADIASTAGVSFTINHIAAVVIPASFGIIWLYSPATVFLAGAALATASLVLARLVPHEPGQGNEVHWRTPAGIEVSR